MIGLLDALVLNQAGALWVGVIVTFGVFGDHRDLLSRRNLALAALLLLAPFLIDILRWHRFWRVAFPGIFLVSAGYLVWAVRLAVRPRSLGWSSRIPLPGLLALLAILVFMNAASTFARRPADAGYYTNLGTQRWLETGTMPYGDPKLKGLESPAWGAAATYGPLLYVSHIPPQLLLGGPRNPPDADPADENYEWPPQIATKVVGLAFFLLGLFALYGVVERSAGRTTALGVVALYAGSPYMLGLGGDIRWVIGSTEVITGVRFLSHTAPTAVVLLALLAISRPLVAGILLASAAGVLFYPAFFLPAWIGYYFGRRRDLLRFIVGFAVTGAVILALVVTLTKAPDGQSSLGLFLESTVEHQEGFGNREYGGSRFSFWGRNPSLASFWQSPLLGSTSLLKPAFILFSIFCFATFFLARNKKAAELAALIASVAAAAQLWKTHAGGTYVEWYYPFLLIALFCGTSLLSGGDRRSPIPASYSNPATSGPG